jgi:hypothetical protein
MSRGLLMYRFLTFSFMTAGLGSVVPAAAAIRNVCASNAAELRQALAEVSDGGAYVDTPTKINVMEGTYLTEGTAFSSSALTTTATLTIAGSWSSPFCNTATIPFVSTVLDGQGTSGVLKITRPNALVDISKLRIQNGNADTGAGIQVNYGVTANAIVGLNWVAVVNNHASADGGGLYLAGAAPFGYAPIQINSSLIAGNSADGEGGGAYFVVGGPGGGVARLGFVTVASNTAATGVAGGIYAAGSSGTDYSYRGVIAWANSPSSLYFGRPITIDYSDVESFATSAFTPVTDHVISIDPHLANPAAGDFHLASGTPLIRYCPATAYVIADLNGHPFPSFGASPKYASEIGAYEDTVFVDAFDG